LCARNSLHIGHVLAILGAKVGNIPLFVFEDNEKMSELRSLISDIVERAGYIVEDIKMSETGGTIMVICDSEKGISSKALVKLSRKILRDELYDQKYAESYRLEVSSPGIDAPLTLARHFKKNIGREIDMDHHLEDYNSPLKGRILGVEDEGIEIEIKNKKEIKSIKVPIDKIESAVLRLKW